MSIKVSLTGASGAIGGETLLHLLSSPLDIVPRIIVRKTSKKSSFFKKVLKLGKGRIEIVYGDIRNYEDCVRLISGADYVIHLAALIPPRSEHDAMTTYETNFNGTKNMVDAVINSGRKDEIKFVYMGTVAEYGNRSYKHPWGRVGDPIISSNYDEYSYSKIKAERYVLDAELPHFVSVRQTAVAHKFLFKNNMSDGLMFQTVLNEPFEWVTDSDSGLMLEHLVEYDFENKLDGFWNRIYNIGGGLKCRQIGFETIDDGFKLMGRGVKDFFDPNWSALRNFHGMWYLDSDELENYLHFRNDTIIDFWKRMGKKYWYFKLGRIVPKSWIRGLVFKPLLKYDDAPIYYVKHHKDGYVKAFYGGYHIFYNIPKRWSDYSLLSEGKCPDGTFIDYEEFKTPEYGLKHHLYLDHGFDENKPINELDIEDMKMAAKFRGGECLSTSMNKGDLYTKLKWRCHEGHEFMASPYTILFGGFWCPKCAEPKPWAYGKLAKVSPFHAQIYFDDFDESEVDDIYPLK